MSELRDRGRWEGCRGLRWEVGGTSAWRDVSMEGKGVQDRLLTDELQDVGLTREMGVMHEQ